MSEITSKDTLAKLIPHSGNMCLLDEVLFIDKEKLYARALDPLINNPLLVGGVLPAEASIEYAAQGAAIHAALNGSNLSDDKPAFLAAVKKFEVIGSRELSNNLHLQLQLVQDAVTPMGIGYSFVCKVNEESWCTGELSLIKPQ